jgi:hypothetical protein
MRARRGAAELAAMPPDERLRIAADLGLSSADLSRLTGSHPGPSELLPQRLEQLGLDREYIVRAEPAVYRDLLRMCSSCTAWRRCRRDLARGAVQAGMGSYCLNMATLDALTVDAHWSR